MLVYRVAHPDTSDDNGIPYGPYGHGDSEEIFDAEDQLNLEVMEEEHSHFDNRNKTPHPAQDGVEFNYADHCAFENICSLKTWFKGWLKTLDKMGFRVYVYDVPKKRVSFGCKQIAVDLIDCKPTKIHSLLRNG